MDPDAEFNLLTTLYQSVVHDMKHTYPGWDALGQKAQKLGTQLRATAQCLSSFTEAMQLVCDNANNLKGSLTHSSFFQTKKNSSGASRDVGACVTRVCIKQRAIENRMRSWADALCEELAISLQQRGNYWKGRCSDMDKMASKHVKKVRARKQRPDVTAMSDKREICTKVLTEQRTQFSFFIQTLMPVLNAQMNMLDEGAHLRQVVENLDSTVKHVDTEQLVSSIVSDIAQGPDSAWKQCLAQAGKKWMSSEDGYSYMGSIRDLSTRATTPARTTRSISTSCTRNLPLLTNTVLDSSASSVVSSSTRYSKPPLQRRNSEKSIGHYSMSSPNTDGSSTYLNLMGNGAANSSSNTITEMSQYQQNGHHQPVMRTNSANTNTSIGTTPTVYHPATPATSSSCGQPEMSSGSSGTSTSAFLISEACRDIDQLGHLSDLENYGATQDSTRYFLHDVPSHNTQKNGTNASSTAHVAAMIQRRASQAGEYAGHQTNTDLGKRASVSTLGSSSISNYGSVGHPPPPNQAPNQPVRMRTTSASRPPPPARRSSQITAATPTAPSVAEQRMNGSMGSRQSLDSAGLYESEMPHPQHFYQMSSFNRPTPASVTASAAAAAKFRI
ncbi:Protein CBG03954 [Caenorhabditis briggsae]|uniref:Protein CBG03954 n=1 Tax=Caenorhabditis briggsae TaxID=6238 RepID=A8WVU4_CAEBR|nr:Protein CBG03954 [Caenorhabditis briggsae]CAP24757.2 Protein CBG03954 [Caenorhabditis briggsae]